MLASNKIKIINITIGDTYRTITLYPLNKRVEDK